MFCRLHAGQNQSAAAGNGQHSVGAESGELRGGESRVVGGPACSGLQSSGETLSVIQIADMENLKRVLMFQLLLKEMEEFLGCWKSFLLPLTTDPQLSIQTQLLHKALSARGVTVSEEMLKVILPPFIGRNRPL